MARAEWWVMRMWRDAGKEEITSRTRCAAHLAHVASKAAQLGTWPIGCCVYACPLGFCSESEGLSVSLQFCRVCLLRRRILLCNVGFDGRVSGPDYNRHA